MGRTRYIRGDHGDLFPEYDSVILEDVVWDREIHQEYKTVPEALQAALGLAFQTRETLDEIHLYIADRCWHMFIHEGLRLRVCAKQGDTVIRMRVESKDDAK